MLSLGDHVALVDIILQQEIVSEKKGKCRTIPCEQNVPKRTYWEDLVICKLADQLRHGIDVIIDTAKEDRLVSNHDTCLKQLLAGLCGYPRDLVRVVKVRVPCHGLASLLCLVGYVDQGIDPAVGLVEDSGRGNAEPLGSEAESLDVRDADQALANHLQLVRLEIIRVASRDDNVLQSGLAFNVRKDRLPAPAGRLQGFLCYGVCVRSDRIRPGTVHAVCGTDRCCYR